MSRVRFGNRLKPEGHRSDLIHLDIYICTLQGFFLSYKRNSAKLLYNNER